MCMYIHIYVYTYIYMYMYMYQYIYIYTYTYIYVNTYIFTGVRRCAYTYRDIDKTVQGPLKGGGLGSRPIFKKFHETYQSLPVHFFGSRPQPPTSRAAKSGYHTSHTSRSMEGCPKFTDTHGCPKMCIHTQRY